MKETQHIEWKEVWRDEYLKWISGFANAEGGVLVIGKNDKGAVVGVSDAKKLLVDIPNKVLSVLGILVATNLRTSKGKEFIEIVVEPYPYPVSYRGEYHVRSGSTKQELKGASLDKFLLRKQGRHWDGVPVPNVRRVDLDKATLKYFRKLAMQSKRLSGEILREADAGLLEKLHLVDGNYLKRAAVLLFHADPEKFVTGAFVKIGFFRSDADLYYQDEIHGDLFSQVNRTMDFLLTKYMNAEISYEGIQRVETYPVPEEALREAVLNAVAHKDYASATPIQISVYDDKIMLWNPGQLPPEWTVERLHVKHSSQPFNPDVANVFFRAGMIEAWGRGFERMREACRIAGVAMPELRYEQTGLWVVFHFVPRIKAKTPVETPVETPVKTPVETPVKTPEQILAALEANPGMSLTTVADAIGKSLRAVERATAKLVDSGRLRYVGPRKGGHWEILK